MLPVVLGLVFMTGLPGKGERVPGDEWLRFADPRDAGFDPEALEAAHRSWQSMTSAAFLVIADGAIVAEWGDIERRFMCHSVRKSFLSALYGVAWDRGEVELNKTLDDLGIDDDPLPLLASEKQARVLDLLKARSGVFHPAAYAGRTDSRPRGSEGPGRFFAYNNWDFNTLVSIYEQETGQPIFDAFDEYFGEPLEMQDWDVSHGYYHYEYDKSRHPAYPFRMSARDAARFGLLFARDGKWGDDQLVSRQWVRRSSALYSIDNERVGYGFMWWVNREPRFSKYGMYSAQGTGNQRIAVLPEIDMVIVNRANTYERENTSGDALLELIAQIVEARTGVVAEDPVLVKRGSNPPDPRVTEVEETQLEGMVGTWVVPAPSLGLEAEANAEIDREDGHLIASYDRWGQFRVYLQPDGSLWERDSHRSFFPVYQPEGTLDGFTDAESLVNVAIDAAGRGDQARVDQCLEWMGEFDDGELELARVALIALRGDRATALARVLELEKTMDPTRVENRLNRLGYRLLQDRRSQPAFALLQLNVDLHPESANAWDSLGEAHFVAGNEQEATRSYERSLELNPDNENARDVLARLRAAN